MTAASRKRRVEQYRAKSSLGQSNNSVYRTKMKITGETSPPNVGMANSRTSGWHGPAAEADDHRGRRMPPESLRPERGTRFFAFASQLCEPAGVRR
jgi:hypothetical protein